MFKRIKQSLWNQRGTLTITPIVAGLVLAVRGLGLLQNMELLLFDKMVRQRPVEPVDARVLIVEVNEADLRSLKRWPLTDQTLAQVLNNIRAAKPAAIGLDIYRDYAVEPGHATLQQVFSTTPNLIGITKQNATSNAQKVLPPKRLAELDQVAVNDVVIDSDGRLRRALLYLSTEDWDYESLGLRLALTYLEGKDITPNPDAPFLQLQGRTFAPFESHDGPYVGADAGGTQMLLNYRGGHGHFDRVSLSAVLAGQVPATKIADRVVLIGATAVSLNDNFLTPYSQGSVDQPLEMSGVEFHANVVSHVLSKVLDGRPGIWGWSERQEMLWIIAWGLLGTGLTWHWRFVRQQRWPFLLLLLAIVGGGLPIAHYWALVQGYWVPLLPPLLTYFGGVGVVLAHTAYRAAAIRQTFGRYLSDEVVNQLLESPTGSQMGGERREVTMLISDLRGFSAIAEQYAPEQVMQLLNHYLSVMTDVITQYQGTIDELMGDSILVMFGAPTAREDDVDRALACAIAMQLAMENLGERLDSEMAAQVQQLEMGIGLHWGEVVVGNIGSMKRAKYGIVGSPINLTARIESYTVGGQILISDTLAQQAIAPLALGRSLPIRAKGFPEPILVHDLRAIAGTYAQALPPLESEMRQLSAALAIEWTTLKSKQVQHPMLPGQLTQLAVQSAVIVVPQRLAVLGDVKLNLMLSQRTEDIYAKVTEQLPTDPQTAELLVYRLQFTFVPLAVQQTIDQLLAEQLPAAPLLGHETAKS
ncbi:adenylate/guanylate cyclase domain-containing protein [filamentous cyanobacterium LEGE 11480]|uniref:Adenylate/guanylate cyclase domain-containing protein n=1 Tax=Romeriopsis navalis LEGE 11480 TaxID=2777977 RepID=A0A928VUS5_9CYAN|nr:adenylate/guanylate cyclase domain-containing protein [Romeriopsis navalis]MBE9032609.1 adenylate/guanylate cyclase domain-containing protein [Romeriopsis navalis LEGE 11480]